MWIDIFFIIFGKIVNKPKYVVYCIVGGMILPQLSPTPPPKKRRYPCSSVMTLVWKLWNFKIQVPKFHTVLRAGKLQRFDCFWTPSTVRYLWGLGRGHGTVGGKRSFPSVFTVLKKKKGRYQTWTSNLLSVHVEWTKIQIWE